MKKTFRIIILCAVIVSVLALSACGNGPAEHFGDLSIEEIQDAPLSFLGYMSLTGTVGYVGSHEFTLINDTATFEVNVVYRGNQALPQTGDVIVVEGQFSESPPCCGPGFRILSTQFHTLEV